MLDPLDVEIIREIEVFLSGIIHKYYVEGCVLHLFVSNGLCSDLGCNRGLRRAENI